MEVGDVVRVISKMTEANVLFEIGDVGVITQVDKCFNDGAFVNWYAVTFPRYGDWDWLFDGEFEEVK